MGLLPRRPPPGRWPCRRLLAAGHAEQESYDNSFGRICTEVIAQAGVGRLGQGPHRSSGCPGAARLLLQAARLDRSAAGPFRAIKALQYEQTVLLLSSPLPA